jgi:hypothetical protein
VAEANYEIRIKGRLSDALLPAFEGMAVTTEPAETTVYGALTDQASVHELLAKLESLGLEVVEFRRLPEPGDDPGAAAPPSP